VFLAVKAHQVTPLVAGLKRLLTGDTVLLTLQNGIPWWYFQSWGAPSTADRCARRTPTASIAATVENERIIGSVVYPASELLAPGVVKIIEGNRFTLGEPDGSKSERVQRLSAALVRAGFKAPITTEHPL